MDFPIFHLDLFGNRMLIAVIAILHVIINHGLAVGLAPIITAMEWYGFKTKQEKFDKLAYKLMFVAFVITTTVGALTGVGIWFSVALVNPYSISSLIRVFFWAWFVEWIVFVTEVCLILAYFLTWKNAKTDEQKKKHIWLGVALSVFSWITMAIIVAILGFMMDPGNWLTNRGLLTAIMNPLYLPQLGFRTCLAIFEASAILMFLSIIFTKKDIELRKEILRMLGLWMTFWAPICLAFGWWYYSRVPVFMKENVPLALIASDFGGWQEKLLLIIKITVVVFLLLAQLLILVPQRIPAWLAILPMFLIMWLTGHFERVREFIRKPYIIGQYMYANGMRVEDYPLLQKDGMLAHATFSHPLTDEEKEGVSEEIFSKMQDGKDVFLIACSRCHTINGTSSVIKKFDKLMNNGPWDEANITNYIQTVHDIQQFMPPFPGTAVEAEAMTTYLVNIKKNGAQVSGAQSGGIKKR